MTEEKLQKANELIKIIETTEKGLKELYSFKNSIRKNPEDRFYDDCVYWLNIGEHNDRSGFNADLKRYNGNAELLDVIIKTLEKEIEIYVDWFLDSSIDKQSKLNAPPLEKNTMTKPGFTDKRATQSLNELPITRVVFVDKTGRVFDKTGQYEFSIQDDGKTLKIFKQ